MNDDYYMNIALKEAEKAFKKKEVPVGAIIVLNDKIIGIGHNKREFTSLITNHAELIAIKKAGKKIHDWRLNEATMYVTLFPCPMCASAIMQSRIKRLVIGAPSHDLKTKKIVNLILKEEDNKNRLEIKENVLESKCSMLLKEFFKEQRKNGKIK